MQLSCASKAAAQILSGADCRVAGHLFHQLDRVGYIGCPDATVEDASNKPEL